MLTARIEHRQPPAQSLMPRSGRRIGIFLIAEISERCGRFYSMLFVELVRVGVVKRCFRIAGRRDIQPRRHEHGRCRSSSRGGPLEPERRLAFSRRLYAYSASAAAQTWPCRLLRRLLVLSSSRRGHPNSGIQESEPGLSACVEIPAPGATRFPERARTGVAKQMYSLRRFRILPQLNQLARLLRGQHACQTRYSSPDFL
jgi:hypothetical protein